MRLRISALLLALLAVPVATAQDPHAAKDPRNFNWVEEGVLAIGGGGLTEADVDWLHGQGFRAIADFRIEHQDPEDAIRAKGMSFLDMPIDSAANINATQLATFVAWAKEQQAAGRPIYIHCTNGWHRAAAFAVAWAMSEQGLSYDEAAREAVARRPGTVMRAIPGMLDLQAELRGEPALAVALSAPTTRPELGGTMTAHVDVYADGRPAPGASVRVWGEESKMRVEGVTDASGRFTFTYQAPEKAFMDHLYARATLPGQLDGADAVEFFFGQPAKTRGALEVVAEQTDAGVVVRVTSAGKPLIARVIALAPGFTAIEATDKGIVTFRDLPSGTIEIRAAAWGAEGGSTSIALAGAITPPPPLAREPPVREPSAQTEATPRGERVAEESAWRAHSAPPAAATSRSAPSPFDQPGEVLAVRYAAAAVAGAVCLLVLYSVLSRKRAGTGSR